MNTQEILFMKFFEENLLTKTKANFDTIRESADLIGYKADINCPACARNAFLELLNIYNRMLNAWNKYKEEQYNKPLEPIHTKYEAEVIEEEFKPLPEKVTPEVFKKPTKKK